MKKLVASGVRLLIALAAALALSGAVYAQSVPPPPSFTTIDGNGVDLTTGQVMPFGTTMQIGTAESGLTWQFYGSLRDNYTGSISPGTYGAPIVSLGNKSMKFGYDGYGGYVGDPADGELTYDQPAKIFTYTSRDGTVAIFDGNLSSTCPVQADNGLVTNITKPNGEVLTYTYAPVDVLGCRALESVVSNRGFMVDYEWSHTPSALTLVKVTLVNLAVEYCVPFVPLCSYTNTWPSVSFSVANAGSTSITTETDSTNRSTSYTYGGGGRYVTAIQKSGRSPMTFGQDIYGRVVSASNGSESWTYSYVLSATQIAATTVTDPIGRTMTVHFDTTCGRPTSVTDYGGRTTTYDLDMGLGGVARYCRYARVTQPEGNYTDYTYDARGNLIAAAEVAKPGSGLANRAVSASYDAVCANPKTCNQPNSVTEAGGQWDFTYDAASGGVATITGPVGATGVRPQTRYSYVHATSRYLNTPSSFVTANIWMPSASSTCGSQATCAGTADETKSLTLYGSPGQPNNLLPTTMTISSGDNALVASTDLTYDVAGRVILEDGPLPGAVDTVRYRYDTQGRRLGRAAVDPDGQGVGRPSLAERFSYRGDGQIATIETGTVASQSDTDWTGFTVNSTTTYDYDTLGRKASATVSAGGSPQSVVQYSYDSVNRSDCVAVRMNPAAFGSLPGACSLGPAGGAGPDRIMRSAYDNANQIVSVTSSYGTSMPRTRSTMTYTPNGMVRTVADGNGNLTTFDYDGFDRLVRTWYPSISTPGVSSSTDYSQVDYDAATGNISQLRKRDGQTVSYSYDGRHNLLSKSAPASTYGYDNLNRPVSAAQDGRTVTLSYDALGRVSSTAGPLGTLSYQYDAAGNRTRLTWPDGYYVNYTLDFAGQVAGIVENGATALLSFGYDDLGRRSSVARNGAFTTAYSYDPLSRLTGLSQDLAGTAQDQSLSFAYNAAGQVVSRTSSNGAYAWNGLYAVDRPYGVNGLNQLTTSGGQSLSYNGLGALTSDGSATYSYDADSRLTGISGGAGLAYDPLDRLFQITAAGGGAVTKLLYDGNDLIGEYDASGALLRRYVHGLGTDEPLLWYEDGSTSPPIGSRKWFAADNQGSIVAVTDAAGVSTTIDTYDEYGIPGASNLGRFQYTGQIWLSELGLYHYKARAYSPYLGRFLQADPIGYDAGALNLYAYVGNDPVNRVDPLGLKDRMGCVGQGAGCGASARVGGGCVGGAPGTEQVCTASGANSAGLGGSPFSNEISAAANPLALLGDTVSEVLVSPGVDPDGKSCRNGLLSLLKGIEVSVPDGYYVYSGEWSWVFGGGGRFSSDLGVRVVDGKIAGTVRALNVGAGLGAYISLGPSLSYSQSSPMNARGVRQVSANVAYAGASGSASMSGRSRRQMTADGGAGGFGTGVGLKAGAAAFAGVTISGCEQ